MFCNKCGSELSAGSRFCTKCGASVESEALSLTKAKGKMGKKTIALLAACVGVVLLIVAGVIVYNTLFSVRISYETDPSSGEITVTKVSVGTKVEHVEIPAQWKGKPVTRIGNRAFEKCRNLTSIELPDNLTHIENLAFHLCENLTSIELPDSVTHVGDWAFAQCYALTDIELPDSVTYIGDNAFDGCMALTSIELPDNLTYIGDNAFYDTALTSIELPDSVTHIGDKAFGYGCHKTVYVSEELYLRMSEYIHDVGQNGQKELAGAYVVVIDDTTY